MKVLQSIPLLLLRIATALCLTYALFTSGLFLCTTPQATESIGHTFSNWNSAIFPEEDMAAIAEAVRVFSVEGGEESYLVDTIHSILEKNYPDLDQVILGLSTPQETQRYLLTPDAISHLRDCTPVFQTVAISTGVIGAFGLIGLIALVIIQGRKSAGSILQVASLITIGIIVGLGMWALLDFDSLFTFMHSCFFAQGTWLFDARSLLIQLFPENFWAAMAFLWAVSSIIVSIIACLLGKVLKL